MIYLYIIQPAASGNCDAVPQRARALANTGVFVNFDDYFVGAFFVDYFVKKKVFWPIPVSDE